ncbi:platelet endothelial aggregation receptor 1-like isoform X2 [Littorina saxatilis]|uniref:platelet endothelial aggregation receptor 1-like isoform X2 n=1 Tax=Littorina saxatilis TaxID=31220 RepID=UPI0038B5E526
MVPVPPKEYHWWQVDLGRTYPVHDIIVWARTGYSDRLYPFTITVDNQTCVNVTSDPGTRSHSVTCTAVMYGQLVRLTLMKKTETLNLCELQIFVPGEVSQCKAGRYGRDCQLECGKNCGGGSGRNFCYQDTGVCYDGCNGNVAGDFCTACPDGRFGNQCERFCFIGCARCDQRSGVCTACTTNSHLALPGCTECEDGYYKQTASSCIQCPGTCDNNTPCDKTTGHCQQCPPGKTGDICDQDCQAGLYGDGCNTRCGYCRVNTTCHHQDGRCPEGCVSGFTEPFCLQVKEDASKDSLVASVVGSVIGAAVIIVVGVVAAVCWYRRSRGGPTEKRAALQEPGRTRSANKTMDSSDHRPPSSLSPQEDTTYYEISDTANTHEMREVQNNYDVLNPYSNDDTDRQPYAQLTSHAADVNKSSGNTAYANTACL